MNALVEQLFHQVVDLPVAARARYFADHAIDEETRREVEALLAFEPDAGAFLVRGISVAATRALSQAESTDRRCGPYQLLTLIGRGGMGAVYLAERVDGEVVQRVAVKLLPPGAGDAQHGRFLLERQILATITHPNIARLLDAGHLDHGQPFLAMEYVDGQPIDVFAEGLDLRRTVALFLKVCGAVAYLHRHLVVHRDLKPSNILVTSDGEPKLLDFGIAKLLDVATDSTMTSMRMLTPAYASPEQVAGGKLSTATDIYSLGALLYRLLTGKETHQSTGHSAEAIASAIVARDATRPSKWAPQLKGDLDCILLKALRRDPHERYETVEHFAEDLEAFLDSRPVRARAGNVWYRARKFLRHYWLPVTAAAIVIVSLAAGLYIANRERAIAQRRFADVRRLAIKLFDIDAEVTQLGGSTKARQLIVNTALDYLQRLRADLDDEPELALEVGKAYILVARVEGVRAIEQSLGQVDAAERDLQIAGHLIDSVLALQPANRAALLSASEVAQHRMVVAEVVGRRDEALALALKSAELLERFNAGKADYSEASEILTTYESVANYLAGMYDRPDEALQLCRRGIELAAAFEREPDRGFFLNVAANVSRYHRGDLDQALKQAREAVRLLDPGSGGAGFRQTLNFSLARMDEGLILGEPDGVSLGRSDEAVRVLQHVFELADEFVHKDSRDETFRDRLTDASYSMGKMLRQSDPARALSIYDHALRHTAEVGSTLMQSDETHLLADSAYALRRLGRPAEARQRLDAAFARLRQLGFYPAQQIVARADVYIALSALADHEADTGNVGRAIEVYKELLDGIGTSGAKPEVNLADATELSRIWGSIAVLYRRIGRPDLAEAWESRRLELWRRWNRKLANNPFVLRQIAAKSVS